MTTPDAQSSHTSTRSGDDVEFTPVADESPHAFRIVEELGRGGMGVVYRAVDLSAGREVALKVAQEPQGSNRWLRFKREGDLTAQLEHPGIVKVHLAGHVDGLPFLAYELVEDCRTLDEVLLECELPEALALVRDVSRALGYAHGRGLIHRDVKPQNVLVDREGRARVADFGLATAVGLDRLTRTGAFIGTPLYMAPEQFAGRDREPHPTADVWSLGVILYQTLTKVHPFADSASTVELVGAIISASYPPIRAVAPGVSAELRAICGKAMALRPEDRYQDGNALADDLDRFLEGEPVLAREARRWVSPAAGLALAFGVLLSAVLALMAGDRPNPAEQRAHFRLLANESKRLAASSAPLVSDSVAIHALFGESAAPVEVETNTRLREEIKADAQALAGLLALAEQDVAGARELLARLGDSRRALAQALSGGVAAVGSGDPMLAERSLSRARERGVERLELLGWRALARVRRGGRQAARGALQDLALLAGLRGGALRAHEQVIEVRALLGAGMAREAHDSLGRVPLPAARLRWNVAIALAMPELEDKPIAALARFDGLTGPAPDGLGKDLVARALERAGNLVSARSPGEAELAEAILCSRIALAVEDDPLPGPLALRLLRAAGLGVSTSLLLDLADVTRDHEESQYDLARRVPVVRTLAHKRRLLSTLFRSLELTDDPVRRRILQVILCEQLAELNDQTTATRNVDEVRRCVELASTLLASAESQLERAKLLVARSRGRRLLGDLPGSLADVDAALGFESKLWGAYRFRAMTRAALGLRREAVEDAMRFVLRTMDSARENNLTLSLAWDLREADQDEQMREALEYFLGSHTNYGGWWARLALLQLRAKDAPAARRSLEMGRITFERNGSLHYRGGAQRLAAALAAVENVGSGALSQVHALVVDLDRVRGGGFEP